MSVGVKIPIARPSIVRRFVSETNSLASGSINTSTILMAVQITITWAMLLRSLLRPILPA